MKPMRRKTKGTRGRGSAPIIRRALESMAPKERETALPKPGFLHIQTVEQGTRFLVRHLATA